MEIDSDFNDTNFSLQLNLTPRYKGAKKRTQRESLNFFASSFAALRLGVRLVSLHPFKLVSALHRDSSNFVNFSTRSAWRPPSNSVSIKTRIMRAASSAGMKRAPMQSTLASLC